MKCQQCGGEAELYELAEFKCCEGCWKDYWRDEDIGLDTSFTDFLEMTCTKITAKTGENKNDILPTP